PRASSSGAVRASLPYDRERKSQRLPVLAQCVECLDEFRRQGSNRFDYLACARVTDAEAVCVQGLAGHQSLILVVADGSNVGQPQPVAAAVDLVCPYWTAHACQVGTDLGRPTREWLNAREGVAVKALDHLVVAARFLAVILIVSDHHFHTVVWMVGDGALDVVAVAIKYTLGDSDVLLENGTAFKLLAQVTMRELVLGDKN